MTSNFFEIFILSIIQGVFEFLPISSSAHLILFNNFFELKNQSILIDISLHLGSLLAILYYFKDEIFNLKKNKTLFYKIAIGTIPIILLGYILYTTGIIHQIRNIKVIAWATLFFGILIYIADQNKTFKKINLDFNLKSVIIIGFFQVLAVLPASAVHDEYLLHVRYRDARPAATIEVVPFTTVGENIQEGAWETVYTRSHLSVDQEALFRYKGRELSLHPPKGEGLRLGLRVSTTLAFRHDPCPTWGLAVNLQKEEHVRRAGQCPPSAGSTLPGNTLAINPSGFGLEELDFSAPIEDWPPKDASCPHQEVCGHSADTAIEVRRASQVQASLAFEGALASYSLALIAVSEDAATTTIVASATPVFRSAAEGGEAPQIRVPSDTNGAAPLSTLSQVALAQELPRGRYVVRVTRTNALAPSSASGRGTIGLCSMLLWRLAVSPLSEPGSVDDSKNVQQRPFVLDMHPPGLHQVPTSIAELSVRLLLSEPLMPSTAGAAPDMVHMCPKEAVPASAWSQDVVVDSKVGAGCFAVSWLRAVARDGQEFEGEEMGWEVMVGLATANMHVGEQYVLWWRGSGWPRGALSGKRMLQPPPFTFSVAVTACSGHGVLAADGSCDCDAQRAGFLCEACSEAVPVLRGPNLSGRLVG